MIEKRKAYKFGQAWMKSNPGTNSDEISTILLNLPFEDRSTFLRGAEDVQVELYNRSGKGIHLVAAARLATTNWYLDVNTVGNPDIQERIEGYERTLAKRGEINSAALVTELMRFDKEAQKRLESYAWIDPSVAHLLGESGSSHDMYV